MDFEDFTAFDQPTPAGTTVHGVTAGTGPPVLLLHGIPETHRMWRHVAPALAQRYTVVATDLRGYGASTSPPSAGDHAPHSMRAVAAEQVEVMAALGHDRFAVVGHDRGGRAAYRMALDSPEVVTAAAVLDVVPTGEVFARADARFALSYWVWSFLAAPAPVPERLLAADPGALVEHMLQVWADDPSVFDASVREAYTAPFRDPAVVHAVCEQYRAAATLDVAHDDADASVRAITCPLLVLWSATGALAQWYEPLEVWRAWAGDVRGRAVDCGHFLPEEAPDQVTDELLGFLQRQ